MPFSVPSIQELDKIDEERKKGAEVKKMSEEFFQFSLDNGILMYPITEIEKKKQLNMFCEYNRYGVLLAERRGEIVNICWRHVYRYKQEPKSSNNS
jgi:hypothetical protein